MITLQDAHAEWTEHHRPLVAELYGEDDAPALAESWSGFTDMLTRDGELTGLQYHYAPSHDDDMPDDDIEFILERMGVGMTVTRAAERPDDLSDWDAGARHWEFTIKRGEHAHTGFYTQGSAHKDIPTLLDVLGCLLTDAEHVEGADFEWFCDELGYDTDSRRAERIYNKCLDVLRDLNSMLAGHEREDLTAMLQELI